ncbi:hypothetical protein [Pseudaminobacter soli (ex Li et al. 2025)]|nr:hypothetical protein [Mesorhizobium soli]
MLEDEFERRLHKTASVGRDGIAWSVSGVNDWPAQSLSVFWLAVLGTATFAAVPNRFGWLPEILLSDNTQAGAILLAALVAGIFLWMRKTKLQEAKGVPFCGEAPTYEGSDWTDPAGLPKVSELNERGRPLLIRRKPKT